MKTLIKAILIFIVVQATAYGQTQYTSIYSSSEEDYIESSHELITYFMDKYNLSTWKVEHKSEIGSFDHKRYRECDALDCTEIEINIGFAFETEIIINEYYSDEQNYPIRLLRFFTIAENGLFITRESNFMATQFSLFFGAYKDGKDIWREINVVKKEEYDALEQFNKENEKNKYSYVFSKAFNEAKEIGRMFYNHMQ